MSPRIISHRGKIDLDSPENDLVGIQEAIDLGVDMVEFDVRRTNDNVLICYHDADINGTLISELSFNEINLLKKRVFKLDEVIAICKDKIGVNLEIKEEGFEDKIVEYLTANFTYENFFVTSFSSSVIT